MPSVKTSEAEAQGSGDIIQEAQYDSRDTTETSPLLASPNARPSIFRSTTQEILFVLTTTMGVAMPSFLQGCTIVISSFVGEDLHMTTQLVTWMTASSALTNGSFLLFFGRLADLFGRRAVLISSLFLFSIFTLVTGFSRDGLALNIFNGILGLISALAVPAAQGAVGSIYETPSPRKNYAFACLSASNPLGFVFGTVFSGIATQIFNWRASFWLLAIIYLVVTVIAILIVPKDEREKLPLSVQSLRQFDFLGAVLTIGGIGLFSAGLSIAPDARQGWKAPSVLAFIILGLLMIVTFVWWECHFTYPLMPMYIWRDRDFSLLMAILTLGFFAFPPWTLFIALAFQRLSGYSSFSTAMHMLPLAISGIIVNLIAGLILHRISNKLLMGIGAASYTVAFLLTAIQRSGYSYWAFTVPALIIVVVGADLEFNVANMYVVSALPKSQQAIAGSIFQTISKLSVTIGLGISTAIFRSVAANPSSEGYYAGDPFEPYAAAFWFMTASAGLSVLLVPWLGIGTQGV